MFVGDEARIVVRLRCSALGVTATGFIRLHPESGIVHRRSMKKIVFLSIAVIIGILFAAEIKRGFLSLLILTDSVRPPEKALMGKLIPAPALKQVSVPSRGKRLKADLYAPRRKGKHPALLIVHGVNPTGKDDEQIVLLAKNLARAGFLVLVPDFEGMKTLRIRLSDVEDVVQSFLYLARDRQ